VVGGGKRKKERFATILILCDERGYRDGSTELREERERKKALFLGGERGGTIFRHHADVGLGVPHKGKGGKEEEEGIEVSLSLSTVLVEDPARRRGKKKPCFAFLSPKRGEKGEKRPSLPFVDRCRDLCSLPSFLFPLLPFEKRERKGGSPSFPPSFHTTFCTHGEGKKKKGGRHPPPPLIFSLADGKEGGEEKVGRIWGLSLLCLFELDDALLREGGEKGGKRKKGEKPVDAFQPS